MENFERKTSPKNGIDTENWFIESYRRYKGHPIRILIALYKGNYHKFVMAVICFFIKHACVWVLPIITANIINDVTQKNPDTVRNIWISAALEIGLIALNIPMNYLYTSYKSLATRYAETGLRKALIRKLQQLSIAYHVETQSGRLQSKIMRDVEAVETLSTQMFLSILNIALNIGVALVVTASKSKIVFVFFLLTTPVAAITMVSFRSVMKKRNTEFRKEMEETSARVMEMVELVPVTRAHALEDEEVHKMSGQLLQWRKRDINWIWYRHYLVQSDGRYSRCFRSSVWHLPAILRCVDALWREISHFTRVILQRWSIRCLQSLHCFRQSRKALNLSIPLVRCSSQRMWSRMRGKSS